MATTSASPPGRFAASGRSIIDSVGFSPEISSERAGWESLALFGWRGHCEEAAFEPFEEPVIVYHVGGAQTVSVRPQLRFRCGVQDPLLTSAIEALERELRAPREHGSLYADSVSDLMALHLLRDAGNPIVLPSRRGSLPAKALQRVLERIEASIEPGISLRELADEASLSRSYFSSAFRESTGVTPHRYLTGRRLVCARDLPRTTTLSLADVALRLLQPGAFHPVLPPRERRHAEPVPAGVRQAPR